MQREQFNCEDRIDLETVQAVVLEIIVICHFVQCSPKSLLVLIALIFLNVLPLWHLQVWWSVSSGRGFCSPAWLPTCRSPASICTTNGDEELRGGGCCCPLVWSTEWLAISSHLWTWRSLGIATETPPVRLTAQFKYRRQYLSEAVLQTTRFSRLLGEVWTHYWELALFLPFVLSLSVSMYIVAGWIDFKGSSLTLMLGSYSETVQWNVQ